MENLGLRYTVMSMFREMGFLDGEVWLRKLQVINVGKLHCMFQLSGRSPQTVHSTRSHTFSHSALHPKALNLCHPQSTAHPQTIHLSGLVEPYTRNTRILQKPDDHPTDTPRSYSKWPLSPVQVTCGLVLPSPQTDMKGTSRP